MDTIKKYLDNIFAGLPNTDAVLKTKRELLAAMEEKYLALKNEGQTDNEALGTVILQFSNVDEIVRQLGAQQSGTDPNPPHIASPNQPQITSPNQPQFTGPNLPLLKEEEVREYISVNRNAGLLIGLGVFLIISGVALMVFLAGMGDSGIFSNGQINDAGGVIGVIVMFLFIAIGVGLFIFSGIQVERFKYLEKGFVLPDNLREEISRKYDKQTPSFTAAIIIGVGLCILSPVPVLLTAVISGFEGYAAAALLLLLVAIAVFIFIKAGMARESYQRLLQIEDYSPEKIAADKVTGAVAGVVFPLAALFYLYLGFFRGLWHPGWLIFPVVGILFGIFSTVYETIKKSGK
ncbi:MAG: hypothetical protein GX749_04380 [Ruminococcaceae bacterium]|nr:hypothetical protein [Oscillospiraceae bacterium]